MTPCLSIELRRFHRKTETIRVHAWSMLKLEARSTWANSLCYFRHLESMLVRYRRPSTDVLQQSFTVDGGYSLRTSSRFSWLSMRCVRAASITSLRGGSSSGLLATIRLALSNKILRSSVSLRLVRSVIITLCMYWGWICVVLR